MTPEEREREENKKRIDHMKTELAKMIEVGRMTFYTEEARAEISKAEILGNIVSTYFEWSGEPIIEAFLSALEDANYHTLRGQIEELL
ncbi:unnamed protein product, partial [marine sediment metagenome]